MHQIRFIITCMKIFNESNIFKRKLVKTMFEELRIKPLVKILNLYVSLMKKYICFLEQ